MGRFSVVVGGQDLKGMFGQFLQKHVENVRVYGTKV